MSDGRASSPDARVWILRALLLLPLVPLAAGRRMVTYQDAIMTHLPSKAATVEQIRAGTFPFLNPYASFGEPLAGNPNFGTFFPDMLAFLVLPLPVAFGLRFAVAAVLAYAGARRWARAEGASRGAAEVAAIAFALSGVYVSTWRFFNSGLALALAPWVMAAAARVGQRARSDDAAPLRRAVAALALVGGLEILAGEPVIALMSLGLGAVRAVAGAAHVRRALLATLAGLALAGAIAAPQIAVTAQVYPTSTRSLAPFPYLLAASTSLTPARLLEQAAPFPFGRPDLTGEAGFTGHEHYDNHAPYLWTLHVGWVVIALLLLASAGGARERWWWALFGVSVLLSFGRFLPFARWLHPVVSLGGRMRFPVKWWYVAALALVPLVARAAGRWEAGFVPARAARVRTAIVLAAGAVVAAAIVRPSGIAALAIVASLLAAASLLLVRPTVHGLAWLVATTLVLCFVPLWRTLVDVVPEAPPHFAGGRVYERAAAEAHPLRHGRDWPPADATTRETFRRAPRELWALTGALSEMAYAFDGDPDGIYFEGDRVVGKSMEALPWPARAAALRAAGVGYVVSTEELPAPYARLALLGPERGVALYRLEGAADSVRVATRLLPAAQFQDVVPLLSRADFDPHTDAVVMGTGTIRGIAQPSSVEVVTEGPTGLRARLVAAAPAVVVWSRTYFRAWRARVDGVPAEVIVADGHLVGVSVPAGAHDLEVEWSRVPLVFGLVLSLGALAALALLRRR
jgi:hypothetical protein